MLHFELQVLFCFSAFFSYLFFTFSTFTASPAAGYKHPVPHLAGAHERDVYFWTWRDNFFLFYRHQSEAEASMQIWAVSLTIRSCHAKMNVFNFGRWHTRTCYGPLIRPEHNKSWTNVWMSWHKIDESSNDSREFFSHSWYEHVSEIATFSNSLKLAFKSFRDHFSPPSC